MMVTKEISQLLMMRKQLWKIAIILRIIILHWKMVHLEWLKMILPAAKLPIAYRKVRKNLYGDRHLQTKAEIYTRYLVEKPFIRIETYSGCTKESSVEIEYSNEEKDTKYTHVLEKTEKVNADCENDGMEAYWTCTSCQKKFSDEEGTKELNELPVI